MVLIAYYLTFCAFCCVCLLALMRRERGRAEQVGAVERRDGS